MEERRDVTAARLLELNPDLLAAGAARVASDAPAVRDEAPVQAAASHVDLSSLPAAGAIHWGNHQGDRLENGRESWRERGCALRYIAVVTVTLKQKTQKRTKKSITQQI